MSDTLVPDTPRSTPLIVLIAVQSLCTAFFVGDMALDWIEIGWPPIVDGESAIESFAALSLLVAIAVEMRWLLALLRRKAHLERQLSLAAGAFHDIVAAQFRSWGLTPSEEDVAMFTLKGLSIAEIAALRGSAEGTVKSHLNGIYRKAGVNGRGAFLSLFIEELMNTPAGAASDRA